MGLGPGGCGQCFLKVTKDASVTLDGPIQLEEMAFLLKDPMARNPSRASNVADNCATRLQQPSCWRTMTMIAAYDTTVR